MDLPIKLKFYKKLELYQELKFQNKKAKGTDNKVWKTEKKILKWTVWDHHFLREPLSQEHIRKTLFENGTNQLMPNMKEYDVHLTKPFENLIARDYAESVQNNEKIRITPLGLLIGEVIYDIEEKVLGKIRYELFYWGTWLVVISASLLVIAQLIKVVMPLFTGGD